MPEASYVREFKFVQADDFIPVVGVAAGLYDHQQQFNSWLKEF
jgi:hypothetical protein